MRSDEQLALEAQRGSDSSLKELVERYHAPLFGFLYRLTGNDRLLAEDLTQEAFLHAIRALQKYQYPNPFKPWLYKIALNCARDHFKQADTRRTVAAPSDEWELEADPASLPEEHLVGQADARELAAAMQALPLHQREALLLRYHQGLTLAEMAETLDVPVGTVKSRLSLGLRRLRERMKDEG